MQHPIVDRKVRVGDLLVEQNIITKEQLAYALREQKISGNKLGKTLIDLGFVNEQIILETLSKQLNIPFVDLQNYSYKRDDVRILKETIARRFRVAVLKKTNDEVTLGMSDPLDIVCLDEVCKLFTVPVSPVLVCETQIMDVLESSYGESEKIASLVEKVSEDLADDLVDIDTIVDTSGVDDAPIAKLLQKIFEEAIRYNSSDIHIEPDDKVLRIRQRIDGVLSEQVLNEKRVASALVVKLKLMAGMDISEKRIPQDGRFNLRVHKDNVDVRISTLPVQHGESVVMRILHLDESVRNLEQVGMPQSMAVRFRVSIRKPNGLVLVTGPTGSGKTTTLYAALAELNTPDKKIITVEDPVEYRLPRLNQVQVNHKIDLGFAKVLKATLRQDPDILLVGEIRDLESAEIALRAAMTGHLVFSTLHTNDAISTAIRLVDMGVDPFLVSASLRTIVAQRLVRKLCDSCKTVKKDTQRFAHLIPEKYQGATFYEPQGCVKCLNTGYKGRLGVFEYLNMDENLTTCLRQNDVQKFTVQARNSNNFKSLSENAIELAAQGKTSLEEVVRISL
jgi:MSHA biogenesis protein MshE